MPVSIIKAGMQLKGSGGYNPVDVLYSGDVEAWLDAHPEALTSALNYATPMQFGAAGDGTTDDTQALSDCATYCVTNNVPLVIPENCSIKVSASTVISDVKQIAVYGTIVAPNSITFRAKSSQTSYDWSFYKVNGELIVEGLKNSIVKVVFATALTLHADSANNDIASMAYNTFILGYTETVSIKGANSGWINENYFYGGRIKNLSFASGGSYAHNNNHFFNNSFESANIELYNARGNYIHNARFEGTNTIVFHASAYANTIEQAWLGEQLPIVTSPSWTDENGTNNFCIGTISPVKAYESNLTPFSFNYDVGKAYPLSGKLHCVAYKTGLFETNLIPIERGIGVYIRSDTSFFRVTVSVYDSNKQKITTQPSYAPFVPANLSWVSDGAYYKVGDVNKSSFRYSMSKVTYSGNDSGVSYVKISVYSGGGDIDGLYCSIVAPQDVNFDPFKPNRLTGTVAPSAGDWDDGTMIYNIDTSKSALGWYYLNGAWHEIGLT